MIHTPTQSRQLGQPGQSGDSIRTTALRTWVAFLVVVGGSLLLLFMYSIRSVILELVVALIFTIALNPLVHKIMKTGLKRVGASIVTILISLVVLLGIVGAIASPLISQGDSLVHNAPKLIDQISTSSIVHDVDARFHVINKAKQLSKQAPKLLATGSSPVLGALGSVFGAITTATVILVLVLFMLMEGPTAWAKFVQVLGQQHGVSVDTTARKIVAAVGGFVNGNLFISLIAGTVALITLLIARVPYPFALAALVAIFDLIPLIGATLATVVVALVALTKGVLVAVIVVVILLIYQAVEGNIIQPVVYGKAVQLSQLLIVVATLVGALLGGIVGVLLAIPVAAAVQIVVVDILQANGTNLLADPKHEPTSDHKPHLAKSVKS